MSTVMPEGLKDARWNDTLATLLEAGLRRIPHSDDLLPPRNYRDAVDNDECDLVLRGVVRQMCEMAEDCDDPKAIKEAVEDELLRITDDLTNFLVGVCNCMVGDATGEDAGGSDDERKSA